MNPKKTNSFLVIATYQCVGHSIRYNTIAKNNLGRFVYLRTRSAAHLKTPIHIRKRRQQTDKSLRIPLFDRQYVCEYRTFLHSKGRRFRVVTDESG